MPLAWTSIDDADDDQRVNEPTIPRLFGSPTPQVEPTSHDQTAAATGAVQLQRRTIDSRDFILSRSIAVVQHRRQTKRFNSWCCCCTALQLQFETEFNMQWTDIVDRQIRIN